MWYYFGVYTIKCSSCGRESYGKTKESVIKNWNKMIVEEKREHDGQKQDM
jgi:hypothetical protein